MAVFAVILGGCEAPQDDSHAVHAAPDPIEGAAPFGDEDELVACRADRVSDFDLLIADGSANTITRYDGATGAFVSTFIARGGETWDATLDEPTDLAWGPEGELFVTTLGPSSVLRFEGETGKFLGVAFFDHFVLEEPMAIRRRADDWVVVGNDTWNLVVITEDGEVVEQMGPPSLAWPLALAIEDKTGFAMASRSGGETRIEIWDLATRRKVHAFGDPRYLEMVAGLTQDCTGAVYAADGTGVYRFEGYALDRGWQLPGAARLHRGPDGKVYAVADEGLFRLDDTGFTQVVAGLDDPRGFEFSRVHGP